jgi:hypothetical protein
MSKLKETSKVLEAESLKFQDSTEKRKRDALQAVAEMLKRPLSAEQAKDQILRTHKQADLLEKRS